MTSFTVLVTPFVTAIPRQMTDCSTPTVDATDDVQTFDQ
jgi:hypothetical protein